MKGKILCIIDGMTDQRQHVPKSLIPFARGWFLTTPKGFETESLPCILSLLGLAPEEIPVKGRGWIEAVGKGIAVEPDDLVVRTTWVKTDGSGRIVSLAALTPLKPIEGFTSLGGYKGILVFKNLGTRLKNVQTYPPHRAFGQPVANCMPKGLSNIAQPFAGENIFLVPWGESVAVSLPRVRVPSVVVCGIDLVRGIGRLMGYEIIRDSAFTGDTDTDLAKKTEAALYHARQGKFVLLHINGADEAAHRRGVREKARFIDRTAAQCAQVLLQSDVTCVLTSDHATDPENAIHFDGPQPFYANRIQDMRGVISGRLATKPEGGMVDG